MPCLLLRKSPNNKLDAGKVRGAPPSISGILSRVRVADSLGDALTIRDALKEGESVVTADGIWLGRSWLRVARDSDEKAGVLERERALLLMDQILEAVGHAHEHGDEHADEHERGDDEPERADKVVAEREQRP